MSNNRGCNDENCTTGSCGSCSHNSAAITKETSNQLSNVKKIIGVVSGKGGVGKSLVTSLLAIAMNKKGLNTSIIDADVTGPSIPKIFGLKGPLLAAEEGIFPSKTSSNIKVVSSNLILENDTDPLIWRGAMIANMVKQFWTDVIWGDVDVMFIDMPPGTGDVPLTVFQSIPVDGIIIVTSPQELVSMIVEKAVNMANTMKVPVYGLVENLSYLKCPCCNEEIKIYGESHVEDVARKHGIDNIVKLPINPEIATACDKGNLENLGLESQVETMANVIMNIE